MNIIPRFIVRRFLPWYLAGFFGYLIYFGSTNFGTATHYTLILIAGIIGFIGMLYWAYKLDQQNP